MKKRLIVVGHGMVGHHFVCQAITLGLTEQYQITVLSAEPRPAYDRVQLTRYFDTLNAQDLNLVDTDIYSEKNIQLLLNTPVTAIDREQKQVHTEQDIFDFDILILATGSYPFVPNVPGHQDPRCFVYRTIEDLDAIIAAAKTSQVGVVVGGGLLGLEAAKALTTLGLNTHVVEFAPQLMAVQIDAQGGDLLRKKIEALNVKVHTQKNTQCIEPGIEHPLRMKFGEDQFLEADLIVFSAGIRPQDQLAKTCGLTLGERGGIRINDYCQTSDPTIYAIGECALWQNRIFGLVAPGYQMATIAAQHLSGVENKKFEGADMSTKLKLMGVDVGSIGDAHGRAPDSQHIFYQNPQKGIYKKLVTSVDGKQLLGAVLIGDTTDYSNLLQLYLNNMTLPEEPEGLILPSLSGKNNALGVAALPDTAQICSCYNVNKATLCSAVREGAHSLTDIKNCTSASTGCGGCTQLVKDIMQHELKQLGITVNNHLCSHFSYTRQELYHLIRVEELKTFDQVIAQHGRGLGCDICKPTVASILASCWNDYILKTEHAGLQDSNDYFLGNIQKDGSYSVVPRVPGGEITPDKLIVLGEVAKQFNLYTKITGGQRVDLFGARVEQLPAIWRMLVDAGFETGHAYGKAVRTVKSCVGSTWCRYGVDDSVGLAIEVENRYKGLRSPHKIKMAVSGCTRECAEAQSKDVGVIATEHGWNLYVCGNGGMRPRHADLLASDLDKETLIRYVDRFLMFYIRTADRLQRTSVWLEKLEGGLDYLRKVIIDDSLGLAAQLETEMANIIGTYQCEWKTTIEDPIRLKRFTHFVNSKRSDDNIVFVQERQQIRPATQTEKAQLSSLEV